MFFASPKVLSPRETEFSASAELAMSTQSPVDATVGPSTRTGVALVPIPYFNVRHGLTPWADVAFHVGANALLGADVKLGLVQSRFFDLAILPGAGLLATGAFANLPIVAGLNPSESIHVFLGPRISLGDSNGSDWRTWSGTHGRCPPAPAANWRSPTSTTST